MSNERNTENLVRERLRKLGYYNEDVSVEEQQSRSPRIEKLLKNASKRGEGCGRPEFIITSDLFPELLIVIECKSDPAKHISKDRDKYAECACDGALLYASFLSKEFDVIAIGVSGEDERTLRISSFVHLKRAQEAFDLKASKLLSFVDYQSMYLSSPEKFKVDYTSLLAYSQELNSRLHKLKVKESQRSLLISAILISLKNEAFAVGFGKQRTAKALATNLVQTVVTELTDAGVARDKIENMNHAYSFIKTHAILSTNRVELVNLIKGVDERINGFMKTHKYHDTLGQFYIEFLRYANNDKGLGIVLTPPHITDLFAEIAEVTKDSIVIDTCCGTGGFLISAMKHMIAMCEGDSSEIRRVKEERIIGIEAQDDIYALAISNMVLQDDGKSGILLGSAFEKHEPVQRLKPNVGLLNPPYKSEPGDVEELEFVLNNANSLQKNGRCVALIPISCMVAQEGPNLELKRRIMADHTVEAVMSMPEDLFHNSKVGVITCTLVLTAHVPHPKGKKTWLGYWRDDGFVKMKGRGRIDHHSQWEQRKSDWVQMFRNREVDGKMALMREMALDDEWCAEAFLTTDYDALSERDFAAEVRKYFAFKILMEENVMEDESEAVETD